MQGERRVPVFVINGFLESGKTTFIREAILRDPNMESERVLVISCEEGETEYEPLPSNIHVHVVGEQEDLTFELLLELRKKYRPTYVIIEYNGVWGMDGLYDTAIPDTWGVAAQFTIIDAETFEVYFANMKSLFADMLRMSSRVFINRCTREDDFKFYRDSVKSCSPRAELIYINDDEGPLNITLEDELPYDLNSDVIQINPDSYMTWYVDMLDYPERYEGACVEFEAEVAKDAEVREGCFVAGNMVMTCCEDDLQFWGLVCRYEKAAQLKAGARVKIRGDVYYEFVPEYGEEEPVLHVARVTTMQSQGKKKKKK